MSPATRPGVFRPLRHCAPAIPLRVRLDGEHARSLGVAGHWVAFADCGAPYWHHAGEPGRDIAWCLACWSQWTRRSG
jgi:hypothetical protein